MTTTLARPSARQMGVAVLLVYGMLIPVPRDGAPGFRLTVQADGAVHAHPVGFSSRRAATVATLQLMSDCHDLGLSARSLLDAEHGIIVRRRPTP